MTLADNDNLKEKFSTLKNKILETKCGTSLFTEISCCFLNKQLNDAHTSLDFSLTKNSNGGTHGTMQFQPSYSGNTSFL